jgi:MFS family permease
MGLMEETRAFETQVQQHLRRNMAANLLDGALFWFGINFFAAGTIVPLYVRHLTDSRLLIGLVATISGAGWYLPQLLTANYLQRVPRMKPVVIQIGLFAERLPLLAAALSALLLAQHSPSLALVAFFVCLAWFNLGAGFIAVAWQEMFAKVIPVQYRGRLLGVANFVGTATGVLGAGLAASVLDRFAFPTNFGLCFSLAFLFILLSWASLAATREPPLPSRRNVRSFTEYLRSLPSTIRQDGNFGRYLAARIVGMLARMGTGFLAVYAADRWQLSDSRAGLFTTAMVVGQAGANLILGALADRRGHKLVLEISLLLTAASMAGAVLVPAPAWMYFVFVAVGAAAAGDILAMIGIVMEFSGIEERPTYMGLANTIPGLSAAVAPMIGGWIAQRFSYPTTFASGALLGVAAFAVMHWMVVEPRTQSA